MVSENTDKPLKVSNCHHAAIEHEGDKCICCVCRQPCTEVELLVEDKVNEEDERIQMEIDRDKEKE